MTFDKTYRLSLVHDLLEFSKPLEEISTRLLKIEWDYEGTGIELTCKHITNVLQKYVLGQLTADEVEAWANFIEGREDVYFKKPLEHLIGDILHELANPELTQRLKLSRAEKLIKHLTDEVRKPMRSDTIEKA